MMATRVEELPQVVGPGERVLRGDKPFRLLPFIGPAFVACVAYIDPGNFATNIAGGSKFGYTLVWVIVASNLMAMLIQTLSAKLGIATGRNLHEGYRPRRVPGRGCRDPPSALDRTLSRSADHRRDHVRDPRPAAPGLSAL